MGKRLKDPYNFFATSPARYDRTAYADGPTGQTGLAFGMFRYGLPLTSGTYFTQRWGFWGDENNKFFMVPMPEGVTVKTQTTGWDVKDLLPHIDFNTSSSKRFASFSFCFDSSGVPLFTVEDHGDASVGYYQEPLIRVSYSGGLATKSWDGASPVLFNMAQVNYPFGIPSNNYPYYQTGEIACFYLRDGGANVYMRTRATNFETPYLVSSGLTPGLWNTIRIERNIIDSRSGQYPPHKSVMFIPSSNRERVKVVTSKSHINYAIDDFQDLPTGFFYGLKLTEGYGNWVKYSEYSDTSGLALDFNHFYRDDFEEYETGIDTFFLRGLDKTFVNVSGQTDINQDFGSIINVENYIIENFEVYPEGFINVMRRNVKNVGMTGYTTGITTSDTRDYNRYHLMDFERVNTGVIFSGKDMVTDTALLNDGSLGGTTINVSSQETAGYIGEGRLFPNPSYLYYPHNSSMLFNDFTIEFWAKRTNSWEPSARFIDKHYINGFAINRSTFSDNLAFTILSDYTTCVSVNPIPLNTWTHIACVRSGSNARIYLSGALNRSVTMSSATLTSTSVFALAQNRSTAVGSENLGGGSMDEVRLWNYARSPQQISANFNQELSAEQVASDTGLLVYLKLSALTLPRAITGLKDSFFANGYITGYGFPDIIVYTNYD